MIIKNRKKIETYGKRINFSKVKKNLLVFTFVFLILALTVTSSKLIMENQAVTGLSIIDNSLIKNSKDKIADSFKKNDSGQEFIELGNDYSKYSSSPIISDLPKSAKINLKVGVKRYSIGKNSIIPGTLENPDLSIEIPEYYIEKDVNDLCTILQEARNNGELSVQIHKSKAQLLIKYSNMMKYKSCLGF